MSRPLYFLPFRSVLGRPAAETCPVLVKLHGPVHRKIRKVLVDILFRFPFHASYFMHHTYHVLCIEQGRTNDASASPSLSLPRPAPRYMDCGRRREGGKLVRDETPSTSPVCAVYTSGSKPGFVVERLVLVCLSAPPARAGER